jgi:hypothetical protein
MRAASAAVVFTGFALTACVTTRTKEEAERDVATQVLKCPSESIELVPFAGDTRIAKGCGGELMITCAQFAYQPEQCFPMQDLRQRAAFELDCLDKASIQLVPLDALGRTVGVTGCGKRGTYQYVQVASSKMDWVMSSAAAPPK